MTYREDTGSRTEADAAAFERHHAVDYDDHRPTRAELDRDEWCDLTFEEFRCSRPEGHAGACYDQENDAAFEDGHFISRDLGYVSTAAVLLFCILGSLAFLGFLALGQKAICEHGSQPLPSYCSERAK